MNQLEAAAEIKAPSALQTSGLTTVFLLAWAHFLNDGAASYLPGVLPALLTELHIPLKLAGTVMAAQLCGQALQPVWGWVADEIGGRWFVILGLSGSALGGALIGLMPGFRSLAGVLLLLGTASAMFHPPALSAVRSIHSERPGFFMSAFLLGGQLGLGVWPLLASLVVVGLGIHWLPLLMVPALLSLPFLMARVPALAPRSPDVPRGRVFDYRLVAVIAFGSLEAAAQFSLVTFLPIVYVARGGSLVGAASMVTVMLSSGIVGNLIGGHLSDRYGHRFVLLLSAIGAAIGLAAFQFAGPRLVWSLLPLIGVFFFSSTPAQILVAQDILPKNRSFAAALALGFSNGIGGIMLSLLGLVASHSVPAVFWIDMLMLGIATWMAVVATAPAHQEPALAA